MRTTVVSFGLAAAFIVSAPPLRGQGLFTDGRRAGMAGVSLTRDGSLRRYNAAYRAVPDRPGLLKGPKLTIPLPIGLIKFFSDHPIGNLGNDPFFQPDSAAFNPVALLNLILSPPLNYQIKEPLTPTNDVAFGVGKDSLQVDLGLTQKLVPADEFGFSGSIRPIDLGLPIRGVHLGVMGWMHDEVDFALGDSLLAFLKNAHPARHRTLYNVTGNAIVEAGVAPTLGYAGRLYGNKTRGLYLGVTVHYYIGLAYGRSNGAAGFTTGDTIFAGPNIVTPSLAATTSYSKWGNSAGHGFGTDAGLVWTSGPVEFGIGVNDIGATITWPDTRTDYQRYDTTQVAGKQRGVVTDSTKRGVETKTKLPVSYIANVAYSVGGSTVGANVINSGRGATLHLGVEQRFGPLVLRGGVSRDQRKKLEFGWGGGIRLGAFELDAGFWTHSNALSDERGITLATSFSIY